MYVSRQLIAAYANFYNNYYKKQFLKWVGTNSNIFYGGFLLTQSQLYCIQNGCNKLMVKLFTVYKVIIRL